MDSLGGPWVSYCFRQSNEEKQFRHPHLQLQYDKFKCTDRSHSLQKRLRQQKQRVLNSTVKRVLIQKSLMDKERLYYHYAKGFDLMDLAKEFRDDLPEFMEFYDIYKGTIDDERIDAWYKRKAAMRNARLHSARALESQKSRPASADAYQRRRRYDFDERKEKKKVRTRSAPSSRKVGKEAVKMVSKSTQDEENYLDELASQSKSGCVFCPVECRPVSSSTWDQRSSTGLQATPGPSHYQYFHFKKYFLYQRPMSAIGLRMDYLESTGRKESKVPHFDRFSQACTMFPRDARSTSPRSRSPRSPTALEPGQVHPREAWAEDGMAPDEADFNFLELEDAVEDHEAIDTETREVLPPLGDGASRSLIRNASLQDGRADLSLNSEDSVFNEEVRQHAVKSYELAARSDRLVMPMSTLEEVEDAMRDSRFVPIRMPTPSPISSRSASSEEDQSSVVKPLFHRPAPSESTDMLTGRVFVPGMSVPLSPDELYPVEEEESPAKAPSIVVEIRTPEPLSVKRMPEPEVRTVHIVAPREKLGAVGEADEVSSHVSDKIEEDVGALSDRTVTASDVDSIVDELTAVSVEKVPSSILKTGSDEQKPSKQTSKVSFNIVEQEELVLDKPPLTESLIIASLAKDDEREIEIVIPEIIFEEEVYKSEGGIHEPPSDSKSAVSDRSATEESSSSFVSDEVSQKSARSARLRGLSPKVQDPDDEYLRKLLAPPDLGDFVPPVYDPVAPKVKKKKKKLGGTGEKKKKRKGKKKATEKVPPAPVPEEPLFTYVKRADREVGVIAEESEAMREETAELHRIVSTVKQFDELYKEKMKSQPWLFGRMALSKQICRFWLPGDLRVLEGVSPSQYLSDYCVVCKRRQKLYSMTFDRQLQKRKHKQPRTNTLSLKEAETALRGVHGDVISENDVADVYELLCIDEDLGEKNPMYVEKLDKNLFTNLCALTERIFYNKFVVEDSEDTENSQKHRLEKADFEGLEWKLKDINISKELKRFLLTL